MTEQEESVEEEETGKHDDPDFTIAGTPLYEWMGNRLDDASITAAKAAVSVPKEPFLIGAWYEPSDPLAPWAERQRRALRLWLKENHVDLTGRLRLNTKTTFNPKTNEECRVAYITYDPKPRQKKKQTDGS